MRKASNLIVDLLREDSELRVMHLQEAIFELLKGDKRTSLLMFRNLVNATIGFPKAAKITKIPEKSLMRMLSERGNPQTDNLFKIINLLMSQEKIININLKQAV